MTRGDLTEGQCALVEPHLPIAAVGPIPDLLTHFNAVMWRFGTGSPWRHLPAEFGPRQSTYDRLRIWARQGVFQQLMEAGSLRPPPVARPTWAWSAWTPRAP
ncbi:transposase [Streptomyces sp. NPDC102365]|uniref:transposase n=1 Tax=Streptomyces sp. NPDC102365 TaxID=3366162 RepID=UPI0037FDDA2E